MIRFSKSLVAIAAVMLSFSAAQAATVNVSGSGFFGDATPTTAESAAGQTFNFSFITEDPIPGNPDTILTNPLFTLAGHLIAPTITAVHFQTIDNKGLFDLQFSDNNILSFYGNDINVNGYLTSGAYSAFVGLNQGDVVGVGLVSVSVSVSTVPLPASAPMFGGALVALAAAGVALQRGQRFSKAA